MSRSTPAGRTGAASNSLAAAPTTAAIRAGLRAYANPADAAILQRFFKTGKGEYGEGDVFIGVRLPAMRRLAREGAAASLDTIARLLPSRVHEERLLALLMLVNAFARADDAGRRAIYDLYLSNTGRVNNWDLVDSSAPAIVGGWLESRRRTVLDRLARSSSLWDRRIAIVATLHFIRRGELDDTFRLAEALLADRHDLIHKAAGWMLREAGKRDADRLRAFLARHAAAMPRTMLRYAIERFTPDERRRWMQRPRPAR